MAKFIYGLEAAKKAGYKAALKLLKTDTPLTQAYYEAMFKQFLVGVSEARADFEDHAQETGNTLKNTWDC